MNRAKVIGPSRAISSWIRATRSSSCPTASRSGTGSRRMPGVTSTARAAGVPPTTSRTPGPDEGVATEQDRDRRRRGRGGELAEPRICDSLGEQQVGGESILGGGPAGLLGTDPVGEEDAAVDDRRVGELAEMVAQRARPVTVEEGPEDGPGRDARDVVGAVAPGPGATPHAVRAPPPRLGSARRCAARARPASPTRSGRRPAARREGRRRPRERPRSVTRAGTGPRPRPPRRRRRGRGRAVRRCRSRAATAGAGRRPGSPPPPRASAAARCRRGGPGSSGRVSTREIATTSAEYRLLASARRPPSAATATNAWRSPAVASGIDPEPRTTSPPEPTSADELAQAIAERPSRPAGPPTIATSPAPAAMNARRW